MAESHFPGFFLRREIMQNRLIVYAYTFNYRIRRDLVIFQAGCKISVSISETKNNVVANGCKRRTGGNLHHRGFIFCPGRFVGIEVVF